MKYRETSNTYCKRNIPTQPNGKAISADLFEGFIEQLRRGKNRKIAYYFATPGFFFGF